jgi:hypothetical protein
MPKLILEWERIVRFGATLTNHLTDLVLVILYVCAISIPTSLCLKILLNTVHKNTHTLLIQRSLLIEIYYVEFVLPIGHCIGYFKEKPLSEAVCVDVPLHCEVVFFLAPDLIRLLQIATLKVALKVQNAFFSNRQWFCSQYGLLLHNTEVPRFRDVPTVYCVWALFGIIVEDSAIV